MRKKNGNSASFPLFRLSLFFFSLYILGGSQLSVFNFDTTLNSSILARYRLSHFLALHRLLHKPLHPTKKMDSLHLDLHSAALNGDDEAVRSALLEGADVNALDAAGRTTIMCAVAGEQYVSLHTSTLISITDNGLVGKIWTRMTRLS